MANALRSSVRRFATTAARAATAETINAYGIRVSKAQGVVDTLVGGEFGAIGGFFRILIKPQLLATLL